MAIRDEFDEARALFDEAAAMYEAAKTEFDALRKKIGTRLRTNVDYGVLEPAQRKLFRTRARLMRLTRKRDREERPL